MKKILMVLCVGILSCGLVACGEDDSKMAAQSGGDYIAEDSSEDEEYYEDEEYVEEDEEYYEDEEYAEEETDDSYVGELEAEIAEFDEVYAGDYGPDYQIVLAFDWRDEEAEGLVMIIPNGSDQMDYFNVGELSGEVGEEQTISGLADYPFSFKVADYSDDGTMMLEFEGEDGGECEVYMQDTSYLRDLCESMGML